MLQNHVKKVMLYTSSCKLPKVSIVFPCLGLSLQHGILLLLACIIAGSGVQMVLLVDSLTYTGCGDAFAHLKVMLLKNLFSEALCCTQNW